MGAADTYISNYTALMRDLGRSQAEARLQSGAAWGNAINQVGQLATNVPGQLADERRAKQQEAIWQANLDRFNQERQEDQWLRDAMNSSVLNGEIDEQRLQENLHLMGAADLAPRALQTVREGKEAAVRLQNAIQTGQIDQAKMAKLQSDALAPYAKALVEAEGDPAVLSAALAAIELQLGPEMAGGLRKSIAENPEGVLPFVRSLIQPKEPDEFTLNQGDVRYRGDQVIASNPKPEEPQNLDQMLAAALKAGDRAKVNEIIKLKAQEANATRAPQAPRTESRSWAFDPKTNQTVYATDSEIVGRGLTQAPTADMRNKEAGKRTAARAVDAVRTLGEGIITKVGPAQRLDAIKRGAEAVFGNDPQFRTYQDSRMALAGTLAVEQQGSRVSDADVRALWLPMVPDAYRDTSESYKLKWELIDAMRGVSGKAPGKTGPTAEELIKKYGGGG